MEECLVDVAVGQDASVDRCVVELVVALPVGHPASRLADEQAHGGNVVCR